MTWQIPQVVFAYPITLLIFFLFYRVTTCLENLEMSGNLKHVRETSGMLLTVREMSGKNLVMESVPKLFITR